jgi:capsule polysaccharide export protein KpsE/RkpR
LSIDAKLKSAIAKRDALVSDIQRYKGRLDSARESLARLESECRAKGIDPNSLDEIQAQLQTRLEGMLAVLNTEVDALQQSINSMEST